MRLPCTLLSTVLAGGLCAAFALDVRARQRDLSPAAEVSLPAAPAESAPESVSLAELRLHPTLHLGRRVRFVLQLQRTEQSWNPCFSRFGPHEWLAVHGWADETFVWEEPVFADPATRLFARRGTLAAELVQRTPAYARLAVTATVREVFLDQPWIEIEALEPLLEVVGEGTLLHVGRALELYASQQLELALSQLERAKAAPLPAHARAEIERLAELCVRARAETEALRRALR